MNLQYRINHLLKFVFSDIKQHLTKTKDYKFGSTVLIVASSSPHHLHKLLDILLKKNSNFNFIIIAKSNHIKLINDLKISNCQFINYPDNINFSYKNIIGKLGSLKLKPDSSIALINNNFGIGYENILDIFLNTKLPSYYFNSQFLFLKVEYKNIKTLKVNLSLIRHIADWNWENLNEKN